MTLLRHVVVAAAAFMLLATSVQYLDRPFRADEADFAAMAREGILVHGVPTIPGPGARSRLIDPDTGEPRAREGMWHPPLYLYTLAGAAWVLPPANWALRGVGLICLLASLLIGWRIVARLAPGLPPSLRAVPVALTLLVPMTVESALFIDIDGTLLLPAVLLLLERWLAWRDHLTFPRAAGLALILAASLAAKLTTPVLAVTAMFVHALAGPRRRRLAPAVAAIVAAGAAVFAAMYATYCAVADYPVTFMLDLYGTRASQFGLKTWAEYALAVRWHLAWASPAFVLLVLIFIADRARGIARTRAAEGIDLLWMFTAIAAGAYIGVAAYWGKYMAPAAFAGALGAGLWMVLVWQRMAVRRRGALGAVLASFAVALALMPLSRLRVGPAARSVEDLLADPRTFTLLALVAGVGAVALAASRLIAAPSRALAAGAAVACVLAVTAVVEQSRVVFARADNGPLRSGVDQGFNALIARLHALDASAAILAPKEVGYYYRGASYPLEAVGYGGDAAIVRVARQPDVRAIVDTREGPARAVRDALDGLTVEQIGSFLLYVKP